MKLMQKNENIMNKYIIFRSLNLKPKKLLILVFFFFKSNSKNLIIIKNQNDITNRKHNIENRNKKIQKCKKK